MAPPDTQVDGSGGLEPRPNHASSAMKLVVQRPQNNDNEEEAVSTSQVAGVKDPVYGPKLRGDDSHHPRNKAWSDAESFHTSDRISGSASSSTLCSGQQTAASKDRDKSKERTSSNERTSNKSAVPQLPPTKSLDECNNGANIHQTQKPTNERALWDIIKGDAELEKIYKKFVPVSFPGASPDEGSNGVDLHKNQEPADDPSHIECLAKKSIDEEFYKEFALEPPLSNFRRHGSGIRPNNANDVAGFNGTKSKGPKSANESNGVNDVNGDKDVDHVNDVGGFNGLGTSSASGTNGVDVVNGVKDGNHINGDFHRNNVDSTRSTKTKDLNRANGTNESDRVNVVEGVNVINGANSVNGVNGDDHVNGLESTDSFQVKDTEAVNAAEDNEKYSPSIKSIAPISDRTLDGIVEMHMKQRSNSKDATPGQTPILRLKDADQSVSQK